VREPRRLSKRGGKKPGGEDRNLWSCGVSLPMEWREGKGGGSQNQGGKDGLFFT